MRKVKYDVYKQTPDPAHPGQFNYGFEEAPDVADFHSFIMGNNQEDDQVYAILELKDGTIDYVPSHKIQFVDKSPLSQELKQTLLGSSMLLVLLFATILHHIATNL